MNESQVRVALWAPKGSGNHYGGPGMTAARLYRLRDRDSVNVTLVHGSQFQVDDGTYDRYVSLGNVLALPPFGQIGFIAKGQQFLRREYSEFDMFHGLTAFEYTVRPAVTASRLGLPTVLKPATSFAELAAKDSGPGRHLRLAQRRRKAIAEHVNAVICISTELADEMGSYGIPEDRLVRIPNGVDTDRFQPTDQVRKREIRGALGLPDLPTIVFVGSIIRRKRPHLLLQALRQIGSDVSAVFVGPIQDPVYWQEMQGLLRESTQLANRVRFVNFTENVEVYYAAADVFCLPSLREGLSNSVLEALSCGLPIVATNTSGMRDAIGTDAGLICDATPRDLGEAISLALSEVSLGLSARSRAETVFSGRRVLEAHEAVFRRIIHGGQSVADLSILP